VLDLDRDGIATGGIENEVDLVLALVSRSKPI
jgi:hypothetical protein